MIDVNVLIWILVIVGAGFAIAFVMLFFLFLLLHFIFRDPQLKSTSIDNDIFTYITSIALIILLIVSSFARFLFTVGWGVVTFINNNLYTIAGIGIVLLASFVWIQYHNTVNKAYLVFRQCYVRYAIDFVILPLANIARFIYQAIIGIWDATWQIYRFLMTGQYRVLLACVEVNGFYASIVAFGEIFHAFAIDLSAFFSDPNFITTGRWNIQLTLTAGVEWLVSLAPAVICFCQILEFLWIDVVNILQLPDLVVALDALFNIFIRILQIPITSIFTLTLPTIAPTVIEWCTFVVSAGFFIEQTIWILVESYFNVIVVLFSIPLTMPQQVKQLFNVEYMLIVTEPLCVVGNLLNMTLEATTHFNPHIINPDGSGIAWFQFGYIFDRLIIATSAFADLFIVVDITIVCVFKNNLKLLLLLLEVVVEFIVGVLFFFFLPTCCQNPFVYILLYWEMPNAVIHQIFPQGKICDTCVGALFSKINPPFGCTIQHILDVLVDIVEIACAFIAATANLLFVLDPLQFIYIDISLDTIQTDWRLMCQCLGDLIRQLDPNFCVGNQDNSFICCFGDLIDDLCQIIETIAQQNWQFSLSFLSLPVIPSLGIIAVPVYDYAIQEAKKSLCDVYCALFSIFGQITRLSTLTCQFPNATSIPPWNPGNNSDFPPQPTCNNGPVCASRTLCSATRLLFIPLETVNAFLNKLHDRDFFASLFVFVEVPTSLLTQYAAETLADLGLILDCLICAVTNNGGPNCPTATYVLLYTIAVLIIEIRPFFTNLALTLLKIFLKFIAAFFLGQNPIGAVINTFVALAVQILGNLGAAVVNFLVELFNALGLSVIGNFIKILYQLFCPILQFVISTGVAILDVLSFGGLGYNHVDFCCNGGNCTIFPGGKRQTTDSTPSLTVDSWISFIIQTYPFETSDPCYTNLMSYQYIPWVNLTRAQMDEATVCALKISWFNRTDNESYIENKCDMFMQHFIDEQIDLSLLDFYTRTSFMQDCVKPRITVDIFRNNTGLLWIPQDILSNPERKFFFAIELAIGLRVYFQYFSDRTVLPSLLLTQTYRDRWTSIGLNTTYLDGLQTSDDVLYMLQNTHLSDYFNWNNATQLEAIKDITTSVWNFFGFAYNNFVQSLGAIADPNPGNMTDILIQSSNLDVAQLVGSISGIASNGFAMIQTIINYWSNVNNLKRANQGIEALTHSVRESLIETHKGIVEWLYDETEGGKQRLLPSMVIGNAAKWIGAKIPTPINRDIIKHGVPDYIWHMTKFNKKPLNDLQMKELKFLIMNGVSGKELQKLKYMSVAEIYKESEDNGIHSRIYDILRELNVTLHPVSDSDTKQTKRGTTIGITTTSTTREKEHKLLLEEVKEKIAKIPYKDFNMKAYEFRMMRLGRDIHGEYLNNDEDSMPLFYGENNTKWQRAKNSLYKIFTTETKQSRAKWQRLDTMYYMIRNQVKEMFRQNNLHFDKKTFYDSPPEGISKTLSPEIIYPGHPGVVYDNDQQTFYVHVDREEMIQDHKNTWISHKSQRYSYSSIETIDKEMLWNSNNSDYNKKRVNQEIEANGIDNYVIEIPPCFAEPNITFGNLSLCQDCFYLNQLFGTVFSAMNNTIKYYNGSYFQNSILMFQSFANYTQDPSAVVVCGAFPGTPCRFPYPGIDNWITWGDRDPKLGFSELTNWINNLPDLPAGTGMCDTSTNIILTSILCPLFNSTIFSFFDRVFLSYSTSTSPATFFSNLVNQIYYPCDYVEWSQLNGSLKRFSFIQTIVIFVLISLVISIIIDQIIKSSFLTFFGGVSSNIAFIFFGGVLVFQYGWVYRCWPLLPWGLGNDIFNATAYQLAPKCELLFSGLITENYTNTNCYSCNYTQTFTIPNCASDLGFQWIWDNILFMTYYYGPNVIDYIRTTPPFSLLFQLPFFSNWFNKFLNVDLTNPVLYSQYMSCNFIYTLIPNYFIVNGLLFFSLAFLNPAAVAVFLSLFFDLFYLAYLVFVVFRLMIISLTYFRARTPYIQSGILDENMGDNTQSFSNRARNISYDPSNNMTTSSNYFNVNSNLSMLGQPFSEERIRGTTLKNNEKKDQAGDNQMNKTKKKRTAFRYLANICYWIIVKSYNGIEYIFTSISGYLYQGQNRVFGVNTLNRRRRDYDSDSETSTITTTSKTTTTSNSSDYSYSNSGDSDENNVNDISSSVINNNESMRKRKFNNI